MATIQNTNLFGMNNAANPAIRYAGPNGNNTSDPTPTIDDSPYGGMPQYPGYNPGWNPGMATSGGMRDSLSGINPDYEAIDLFKQQAERTGPSAWAGLATKNQDLMTAQAKDQAAQGAASQAASAQDAMASRGGLTSGGAQQAAIQGQKNYLNMSQDVERQGQLNKNQIGMNDETNRIQQMGMLPGMEAQTAGIGFQKAGLQQGANQFDVAQQTGETANQNAFNMGNFNTTGQIWGAGKQSQAIANQHSCWLITGLSRFVQLPSDEPQLLEKFKAYMGNAHPLEALFYLQRCDRLTTRMDKADFDWVGLAGFNTSLVTLLRAGEPEAAYKLFRSNLLELIEDYWPEALDRYHIVQGMSEERQKARDAMYAEEAKEGFDTTCLANIPKEAFFEA